MKGSGGHVDWVRRMKVTIDMTRTLLVKNEPHAVVEKFMFVT